MQYIGRFERMGTKVNLNESEIDLNMYEHNSEIEPSWTWC